MPDKDKNELVKKYLLWMYTVSSPMLRALTYTFSSDLTCYTTLYITGSSYMADDEGVGKKQQQQQSLDGDNLYAYNNNELPFSVCLTWPCFLTKPLRVNESLSSLRKD